MSGTSARRVALAVIRRVEGMVEADGAGLRGWAWHPGDPGRMAALTLRSADGRTALRLLADDETREIEGLGPLARARGFAVFGPPSAGAVLRDTQAPTGVYFVSHDAQGHHFSYARAGSAASRMQPSDLHGHWAALIGQSHWLHLSGISLAISASACETALAAMHSARAQGTRIAFDSNLRLSLWSLERAREHITRAIALCDLFLPSLEDMVLLTGLEDPEAIVDWCHDHGAVQVVLKMGAQGALISQSHARSRIPPFKVKAQDATGAGD